LNKICIWTTFISSNQSWMGCNQWDFCIY